MTTEAVWIKDAEPIRIVPNWNTFPEWIVSMFDPASQVKSELDASRTSDSGLSAGARLEYFTALFENCEALLAPYGDGHVNAGLWQIASWLGVLTDDSVRSSDRLMCIESVCKLFEGVFAKRCTNALNRERQEGQELDGLCFVWFDFISVHGDPGNPERREIDIAFLKLIEKISKIPHLACKESALFGMFMWGLYYPKKLYPVLARFMELNSAGPPELLEYAQRIWDGYC